MALCRDVRRIAGPSFEPIGQSEGRHGERHECRDAIADGKAHISLWTYRIDDAEEYATRPRHGVVHLAALLNDRKHRCAEALDVSARCFPQLAIRRSVEVEVGDPDPRF